MKSGIPVILLAILTLFSVNKQEETMDDFALSSHTFKEAEVIPSKYTCEGEDVSPPLAWTGSPAGTKSFALTCLDPDAPPGTWVHWVLYDLPGDSSQLEEDVPKNETLEDGTKQGLSWGVSSFSRVGYHGPCPPPGHGFHRYYFTLYALDVEAVQLSPKATHDELESAMEGHILAKASVMGRYKRD
ncbi:MAG: YbhB/YbcL family Raf kinase inhibitor-like protein [Fidelibacterota bacterium]